MTQATSLCDFSLGEAGNQTDQWWRGMVSTGIFRCLPFDSVHTWQTIVFIQPGMQDMSIIICAYKVSVDWYWP